MAKVKSKYKDGIDYGFIGGICGDVFGSIYERHNYVTDHPERIDLYDDRCRFTDDTVMTVATMHALLTDRDYAKAYRSWGRRYPHAGYGGMFKRWVMDDEMEPYGSWANGALMRVGPIGWAFDSTKEAMEEARKSAAVTHNSEMAERHAKDVAQAIHALRTILNGTCKEISKHDGTRGLTPAWVIAGTVGYSEHAVKKTGFLGLSCDVTMNVVHEGLRRCGAAEHAARWFMPLWYNGEQISFERVIQTTISLGGDSDTTACIAGSLYGPVVTPTRKTVEFVLDKLTPALLDIVNEFGDKYAKIRERKEEDEDE